MSLKGRNGDRSCRGTQEVPLAEKSQHTLLLDVQGTLSQTHHGSNRDLPCDVKHSKWPVSLGVHTGDPRTCEAEAGLKVSLSYIERVDIAKVDR